MLISNGKTMRIALCTMLALSSLLYGSDTPSPSALHPVHQTTTANVTSVHLHGLMADGRGVRVIFYDRGGIPYTGYALVDGMPPVPWQVIAAPAGSHRLVAQDGSPVPLFKALFGRYGYHNPEYRAIRDQWSKGTVRMERLADPPAFARSSSGGWAGTIDLNLPADGLGTNDALPQVSLRVAIEADANGSGHWSAHWFDWDDLDQGASTPRRTGTAQVTIVTDHWIAEPRDIVDPAKGWPQTHGPNLNMSATPCGVPLVSHISDARLQWVAEDLPGGQKGSIEKTPFGLGIIEANDPDHGGYAAPIVSAGQVYLYSVFPDHTRIAADPRWQNDIHRLRGGPLGSVAFGMFVDRFVATDAATGRTTWKVEYPFTRDSLPDDKSGKATTPCVVDGILVGRGVRGLYGLDAATGKELWFRPQSGFGFSGGTSREESLVAIGGIVIAGGGSEFTMSLVGIDPRTGAELWKQDRARGYNSVPVQVILDGKPYILSATCLSSSAKPPKGSAPLNPEDFERMVLIEPTTGKLLWEDRTVGQCHNSLVVDGDLVCAQARKGQAGKDLEKFGYPGVWRVSLTGAQRLWTAENINLMPGRNTIVAQRGVLYIDSRSTGFTALDMASGKIIARKPHLHQIALGDHNWTWTIGTDDRIITSGLLAFSADLQQLPGKLCVKAASGYACPIKPAIADGRLFMRTGYHLVCVDLRADPAITPPRPIDVGLAGAWIGLPKLSTPLRLRETQGKILPYGEVYPPTSEQAGLPYGKSRRMAYWIGTTVQQSSDSTAAACQVRYAIGHDSFPLQLSIQGAGDQAAGSWKRIVSPLAQIKQANGTITGRGPMPRQVATPWLAERPWTPFGKNPEGTSTWQVNLENCVNDGTKTLNLYLDHDGRLCVRAIGMAFSWNTAWHEVDASELVIADGTIHGKMVVILHSDPWVSPAPDAAQVAVEVTIDAKAAQDGSITGTWSGVFGVPYQASGSIGPMVSASDSAVSDDAAEDDTEQDP